MVTWPFQLAVSVAVTSVVTAPAVAVNKALFDPAAITTATGTLTAELLLLNPIVRPPEGAAVVRLTVQLLVPAGPIVPGEQLRVESPVVTGSMVRVVDIVEFAERAETVEVCGIVTAIVATVKLAFDNPAGTTTKLGGTAYILLLVMLTAVPPEGAVEAR